MILPAAQPRRVVSRVQASGRAHGCPVSAIMTTMDRDIYIYISIRMGPLRQHLKSLSHDHRPGPGRRAICTMTIIWSWQGTMSPPAPAIHIYHRVRRLPDLKIHHTSVPMRNSYGRPFCTTLYHFAPLLRIFAQFCTIWHPVPICTTKNCTEFVQNCTKIVPVQNGTKLCSSVICRCTWCRTLLAKLKLVSKVRKQQ